MTTKTQDEIHWPPPRTKEELIEAHQRPDNVTPWGAPAVFLAKGQVEKAVQMLAEHAGVTWRNDVLYRFDLRRVDEQGRLREAGWTPYPRVVNARTCAHRVEKTQLTFGAGTPVVGTTQAPCGAQATHRSQELLTPRRCAEHAGERTPSPMACLIWKAGEHLDAVLRRGAHTVACRAKDAVRVASTPLERRAVMYGLGVDLREDSDAVTSTNATVKAIQGHLAGAEHACKPSVSGAGVRLDVAEWRTDGRTMKITVNVTNANHQKIIDLVRSGSAALVSMAPSLSEVAAMAKALDHEVVPTLRWEDVEAWLEASGYDVTHHDDGTEWVTVKRGDDYTYFQRGMDLGEQLESIARCFGLTVRGIRETVDGHARAVLPNHSRDQIDPAVLRKAADDFMAYMGNSATEYDRLPDSAFLYVNGADRRFPVRDANGQVELTRVRNAIAQLTRPSDLDNAVVGRLLLEARALLEHHTRRLSSYHVPDHDGRLRAAGYDPNAMTAGEIVGAVNRGLLPVFGPDVTVVETVDGNVAIKPTRGGPAMNLTLEVSDDAREDIGNAIQRTSEQLGRSTSIVSKTYDNVEEDWEATRKWLAFQGYTVSDVADVSTNPMVTFKTETETYTARVDELIQCRRRWMASMPDTTIYGPNGGKSDRDLAKLLHEQIRHDTSFATTTDRATMNRYAQLTGTNLPPAYLRKTYLIP